MSSAFGATRTVARAPEKGVFPLDHYRECKAVRARVLVRRSRSWRRSAAALQQALRMALGRLRGAPACRSWTRTCAAWTRTTGTRALARSSRGSISSAGWTGAARAAAGPGIARCGPPPHQRVLCPTLQEPDDAARPGRAGPGRRRALLSTTSCGAASAARASAATIGPPSATDMTSNTLAKCLCTFYSRGRPGRARIHDDGGPGHAQQDSWASCLQACPASAAGPASGCSTTGSRLDTALRSTLLPCKCEWSQAVAQSAAHVSSATHHHTPAAHLLAPASSSAASAGPPQRRMRRGPVRRRAALIAVASAVMRHLDPAARLRLVFALVGDRHPAGAALCAAARGRPRGGGRVRAAAVLREPLQLLLQVLLLDLLAAGKAGGAVPPCSSSSSWSRRVQGTVGRRRDGKGRRGRAGARGVAAAVAASVRRRREDAQPAQHVLHHLAPQLLGLDLGVCMGHAGGGGGGDTPQPLGTGTGLVSVAAVVPGGHTRRLTSSGVGSGAPATHGCSADVPGEGSGWPCSLEILASRAFCLAAQNAFAVRSPSTWAEKTSASVLTRTRSPPAAPGSVRGRVALDARSACAGSSCPAPAPLEAAAGPTCWLLPLLASSCWREMRLLATGALTLLLKASTSSRTACSHRLVGGAQRVGREAGTVVKRGLHAATLPRCRPSHH